ncbi:MAG: hypothetical protein K2K53_02410 [Oscillospiraceae bacterium]|nr:hypothetical protein [Oscillospiraceae bacterium]
MADAAPDGVIVRNIMADGTQCGDPGTYLTCADQLPDLTKRLIVHFWEQGAKLRAERERAGG